MQSQTNEQKPRILILGGTGKVGQKVTSRALEQGYNVTLLVRSQKSAVPSTPDSSPNLTHFVGSPMSSESIVEALKFVATTAQETSPAATTTTTTKVVIISTLGQTRKSGNPWAAVTSPPLFMAESAKAILGALRNLKQQQGEAEVEVCKWIVLSMFGAKQSMRNLNFLFRGIMKYSNMAQTVEDHSAVDDVVSESFEGPEERLDVPFVLVRPPMLKFDDSLAQGLEQVKTFGELGEGIAWMPSIQAKDLAEFLVSAIANDQWNRARVVVSN